MDFVVKMKAEGKIYCKCGRFIGDALEDFQYLRIANADLWSPTRIICRNCGKSIIWKPKLPPELIPANTGREIRNKLGKKQLGKPPRLVDDFEE